VLKFACKQHRQQLRKLGSVHFSKKYYFKFKYTNKTRKERKKKETLSFFLFLLFLQQLKFEFLFFRRLQKPFRTLNINPPLTLLSSIIYHYSCNKHATNKFECSSARLWPSVAARQARHRGGRNSWHRRRHRIAIGTSELPGHCGRTRCDARRRRGVATSRCVHRRIDAIVRINLCRSTRRSSALSAVRAVDFAGPLDFLVLTQGIATTAGFSPTCGKYRSQARSALL
jgi:hypothetical protein